MPFDELRAITVVPIAGLKEVCPGDNLPTLLAEVLQAPGSGSPRLEPGDVLVVTQKVVSKAEGRVRKIDPSDPRAKQRLVESEAVRVLRRRGDLLITETTHGFICANAGVDLSNMEEGEAALLPIDPDRSARRIRAGLQRELGVQVGVVISDTFGRAWRNGVTDVAIGSAGIVPILDLRGTRDAMERPLTATTICIVDEIASAAELVMGKDRNVPAAIVRGVPSTWLGAGSVVTDVVRSPGEDLFR
ncbi:MAG: coenzyme F420-0:L-glutamate ligase [Actinomycetota bacterium]|jgi:coenzyme F420-0:L-glutamate ligase/coenzyme F420-1:gamma-L-glutamate ligase|nr:coenzyme F420-0:L-glutamate ligase [Actinomycetota bacterium]